jgi:hypothetical protein
MELMTRANTPSHARDAHSNLVIVLFLCMMLHWTALLSTICFGTMFRTEYSDLPRCAICLLNSEPLAAPDKVSSREHDNLIHSFIAPVRVYWKNMKYIIEVLV